MDVPNSRSNPKTRVKFDFKCRIRIHFQIRFGLLFLHFLKFYFVFILFPVSRNAEKTYLYYFRETGMPNICIFSYSGILKDARKCRIFFSEIKLFENGIF